MAPHEGVRVDVLVDVPRGARAQGRDDGALLGEAGDDEHARGVGQFAELAQRLDTVHAGHLDVHEDDVRLQLLGLRDTFGAVRRLSHDLYVVLHLQERTQTAADDLVVVDQQHPDPCFP